LNQIFVVEVNKRLCDDSGATRQQRNLQPDCEGGHNRRHAHTQCYIKSHMCAHIPSVCMTFCLQVSEMHWHVCTVWGDWWSPFCSFRGPLVPCIQTHQAFPAFSPVTVPQHPDLFTATHWNHYHDPAVCGVNADITHDRRLLQFVTPGFTVTWWLWGAGSAGCCPINEHLEVDSTWPLVSCGFWLEVWAWHCILCHGVTQPSPGLDRI
jgi:hypothetical protein